ncbi:MAG: cytochrome P450 [Gammaproteobacteria bacterium]|nr:cytochrome P450 [Gammaproteobacteria bacterium]
MKQYLVSKITQLVMSILKWVDYRITGGDSGMTDEEAIAAPYEHYARIRARASIVRTHRNRGWMLLDFDDVQSLLLDHRFSADLRKNPFLSKMIRMAADGRTVSFLDNPTMLNLDPPDHTRLRKLANHGFVHKSILALEPRIISLVDECIDTVDVGSGKPFDVIETLAKPLPVRVIAELLGLPKEDVSRFQQLSTDFISITAIGNSELMDIGTAAAEELEAYFDQVITHKRQHPGDDLISQLLEVEEQGDRLAARELVSTCIVLLIAGHETTTHLIGNGMHLLLDHPEQMQQLRDNPALIPNAIEEMLRIEPPVQFTVRTALEDVEFSGQKIRKNQLVMAVLASANRDPKRFPFPNDFDVAREDVNHITFGYGIHLCLGMSLARLESKVAFERLLARFDTMSLAEQDIAFVPVPLNRGRQQLLVNI